MTASRKNKADHAKGRGLILGADKLRERVNKADISIIHLTQDCESNIPFSFPAHSIQQIMGLPKILYSYSIPIFPPLIHLKIR